MSFLTIYFFGGRCGAKGSCIVAVFSLLLATILSIFIFYEVVLLNNFCYMDFLFWVNINLLKLSIGFLFDDITSIMLMMILLISTLVHLYSFSYMQHDANLNRFISLLSLFTFFMLLLITANNFLQILLGWEGVGICSYLLVNFWSDRIAANRAALKALFFNRIGDVGMILALIFILETYRTLNFKIIFDLTPIIIDEVYLFGIISVNKIDLICLLLVLAAIAKSAQFFLHSWLADAMEGPTPVSALIHAATMVTAGIFLLARVTVLLQYSSVTLNVIVVFGVVTSILFSFSGQNTNDLKKIVASSTASQLAYMFFIIGLLDTESSLFHLFLHAFFKALLFLSAGAIIHGLGDQQDIRKMGGLFKIMPFNTFCFMVGSFSLIGIPLATGSFYSKDPIIEDTMLFGGVYDDFLNLASELGVVNTLYYNLKLMRIVFFGYFKGGQNVAFHDSPNILIFTLSFLMILSFLSPIAWELLMSEDSITFQSYCLLMNYNLEGDLNFYREEEINSYLFSLIVLIFVVGVMHTKEVFAETRDELVGLNKYLYFKNLVLSENARWGYEYFFVKKIIFNYYKLSNFFFFSIDRGVLELIGPLFVINKAQKLFLFFSSLQSGFLYHYVFFFLISVSFYLLLIMAESLTFFLIFLFSYLTFFFFFNKISTYKIEKIPKNE
jgi:proton-translocating NADH-quinone oxidoreductase chain L